MEDSAGLTLEVAINALARVRAAEQALFVLIASHPKPEAALRAWDITLPDYADEGFAMRGVPDYADALQARLAEYRKIIAAAVAASRAAGT